MGLDFIERWVKHGSLHVHMPDGEIRRFGEGAPQAHMHLRTKKAIGRMLRRPDLAVGEAYMDGDWWPGEGGLLALFHLYSINAGLEHGPSEWLQRLFKRVVETNDRIRAKRNIQHHYDLDSELFQKFLDEDMQYSCAYFAHPDYTLEQAQRAKCRHISNKLVLKPGDKVLDIGCGWGGLGLFLAEQYGVDVTGLTLSEDQHALANRRAKDKKLDSRARFLLEDYREHEGEYDAVVSVGMFEHVGRPQYQVYFDQVCRLLKENGRALIHSIGRTGPPTHGNSWIQKYIFPGGYIPALSEASQRIEHSGLILSDVEVWRLHYAYTLMHWHRRFQAQREHFRERLGERFCRMWEFYLQSCEAMFRYSELVVFQMQLGKTNASVPVTRDYLYPDTSHDAQTHAIAS